MPHGEAHALIGFDSPTFLIHNNGKYYVTIGVIEYDPEAARTEDEKTGVRQVEESFRSLSATATVPSVEIDSGDYVKLAQTGPRPRPSLAYIPGIIIPHEQ